MYKITHGVSQPKRYERTVSNVKKLLEIRNNLEADCVIGTGYLVRKKTEEGILDFAKMFVEVGVDYIQFRPYQYVGEQWFSEDAIKIFKLNIEVYPKNANCHDSLGEAYMIKGDKANAIKYYEKALELDPKMGSAIEALKKLRN